MPGDDLYKNLKEPAPDSLPKFEEESWKKMERLLDKHLPEEKGRGRVLPYIFFLGCIILASLTTFLPAKRTVQTVNTSNSLTTKPVLSTNGNTGPSTSVASKDEGVSFITEAPGNKTHPAQNNQQVSISKEIIIREHAAVKEPASTFTKTVKDAPVQTELVSHVSEVWAEHVLKATDKAGTISNNNHFRLHSNPKLETSLPVVTKETGTANKKNAKKDGLSLTFSAGLETPGTAFNTWGRLTPVLGVGLMYNIGDKFFLRTGVAVADKIYSAHDKDYNPANNYWASYTYFKRIDADCKVIEIPLDIAYRVAGGKKTNVYVSAGASSVIMRKEAYEYYYKNQAGRDTVTQRAWSNNSFHLFSSVNFSAIAERKISNRFSLMAEPAIKIPSGGIGVGKIRLYNAGLTVTAKFKLR